MNLIHRFLNVLSDPILVRGLEQCYKYNQSEIFAMAKEKIIKKTFLLYNLICCCADPAENID